MQLDFARLLAELTAGTSAQLDSGIVARAWQVPAMDAERPVALAKGGSASAPTLFATAALAGAAYELAPPDAELSARGLKLLEGGSCAVREGSGGATILCGERAPLLAFGETLAPSAGPLPGGALLQASFGLERSLAGEVYEWRESVPRRIDPLFPAGSPLEQTPGLHLAALDVGFEVAHRLVEAYEAIGAVQLSAGRARAGKLAVTATLTPAAGSIVARGIEAALPARVPAAFWELSASTDSALFFDAGLLRPLLEPSPRALGLLAQAGGSVLAAELGALASACAQPGQAIALATGRKAAAAAPVAKPWPPEVPGSGAPAPPASPTFTLLGLEDAKRACAKAVTTALDDYERLATVAERAGAKRYLRSLVAEKPLAKGVRLVQLGGDNEPRYIGIAERHGALWLGQSDDLALLRDTLSELLTPGLARRSLRARPELLGLAKTPTLLNGFVREDILPFSSARQAAQGARAASGSPGDEKKDVARVPFAIVREGASLRISADVDVGAARGSFARLMAAGWGTPELAKLSGTRRDSGMQLLDAACKLGEGSACNWLGVTYGDGRGVARDVERALPLLERGCELGFGMACANVAFYRKPGPAEELRLFQRSCELNAPLGCAWWGVRLLQQNEPGNQRKAFEQLQIGCDTFVGWACARIGAHYRAGIGLPRNDERSADFQGRACELSFGSGCAELAAAFIDGRGRRQDTRLGMQLLEKACRIDQAEGCYALGRAYLEGHGTPKDEAAAREHLNTACDAEHAEACRALGELAGEP